LKLIPCFNTCVKQLNFISLSNNEFDLTPMTMKIYVVIIYIVNISNDKDEL